MENNLNDLKLYELGFNTGMAYNMVLDLELKFIRMRESKEEFNLDDIIDKIRTISDYLEPKDDE
jgi:hypothetical protein